MSDEKKLVDLAYGNGATRKDVVRYVGWLLVAAVLGYGGHPILAGLAALGAWFPMYRIFVDMIIDVFGLTEQEDDEE